MRTKIEILKDIQNNTLLMNEIQQTIESLEINVIGESKRENDDDFIHDLRKEWHTLRIKLTSLQTEYIKKRSEKIVGNIGVL